MVTTQPPSPATSGWELVRLGQTIRQREIEPGVDGGCKVAKKCLLRQIYRSLALAAETA
jgi:hypothetical protein